jgi:hypothetical protein
MIESNPMQRTLRAFGKLSTTMDQILGVHPGIELWYRNADRSAAATDYVWDCKKVSPVVWFSEVWVQFTRDHPITTRPWRIQGDQIRLDCCNGSWIWVLTGDKRPAPSGVLTKPIDKCQLEARWPD